MASIRKRNWKTRQGEQKTAWVVDYRDQHGKRALKTFARKKDADEWLAEAQYEVKRGIHTRASGSLTVVEAGANWLDRAERDGLERSTVRQYRQHLDLHISPKLGSVKLSELTAPMVAEFETWLRDHGRSPTMVRKVVSSLGSLIADAQEAGHVSRNVVRERPKKRRHKAQASRHRKRLEVGVDIPTAEEVNDALICLSGYGRALFLTAARTGLRASELRGLRWSDLDFEAKKVHVRQRADRWNQLGPLKSGAGQRSIPMTAMLANTLREWRLACPRPIVGRDENDDPIRETSKPDHLVFPNGAGNVENHGNLYARVFAPAWIASGASIQSGRVDADGKPILAPKYGIHALRHFFASWLINEKERRGLAISLKRTQVLLGHSSLQMTADTYGHLLPSRIDEAEEFTRGEHALLA